MTQVSSMDAYISLCLRLLYEFGEFGDGIY